VSKLESPQFFVVGQEQGELIQLASCDHLSPRGLGVKGQDVLCQSRELPDIRGGKGYDQVADEATVFPHCGDGRKSGAQAMRVRNTKIDGAIDQREKGVTPELADSSAGCKVMPGKVVLANIVSDFKLIHDGSKLS